MYYSIEGKLTQKGDRFVVLNNAGIGYKIYVSESTLFSTPTIGAQYSLFTHFTVREDAHDLFGFETEDELGFFEMLIQISGIGPRGALSILSVATIPILKRAIATGDTSYLTKVSGIGKKTAEKVVIELRDKLQAHAGDDESRGILRAESDTIEALESLGYSASQSREALKKVDANIVDTNLRIKEALKILSNQRG